MRVVPDRQALGRPAVEIQWVAAVEDHGVDRGRAAEHLALLLVDAAARQPRLRTGLEPPTAPTRSGTQTAARPA